VKTVLRYVAKRLGLMLISLFAISIITFTLMHMTPGNFITIHMGQMQQSGVSATNQAEVAAAQQRLAERYGIGQPLWKQYLTFIVGAVQFKFGNSFKYPHMTVEQIIAQGFPVSVTLAVLSMAVAVLIAVPLGIIAAVKQNTFWDYLAMFLSLIGSALPAFVVGVFLILLFSLKLKLLPTAGWSEPKHVILPVLAMAIESVGGIARYMRSSLVETLRKEYVAAAWARGGTFRTVVLGHALRNSLIPLVTVLGPQLASMLIGVLVIETMFRIPGLGQYFAYAAGSRDYPLIMGSTLFFATVIMLMNLLVDVIYGLLDPRIRYD
jgi:peptide/nickel transport system permease protein